MVVPRGSVLGHATAWPSSRTLLVSGDRHLLDLRGEYPIVSPRELLDRLA